MSSDEENFRRLLVELRLLEGTIEALQNRVNLVNAATAELAFAAATIDGLEKEKDGAPLLVPIGGGSFMKAEVTTTQTLVVGMGAGISVEKTSGEAKQIVEKRIAELKRSRDTIQQQLGQVLEQMRVKRKQFDDMSTRLGGGRQMGDVRKAKSRA